MRSERWFRSGKGTGTGGVVVSGSPSLSKPRLASSRSGLIARARVYEALASGLRPSSSSIRPIVAMADAFLGAILNASSTSALASADRSSFKSARARSLRMAGRDRSGEDCFATRVMSDANSSLREGWELLAPYPPTATH